MFGLPVEELWIEDAVQKAFVEVNEEGSEAAAATAFFGGSWAASAPPLSVEITIDRPFPLPASPLGNRGGAVHGPGAEPGPPSASDVR